MVYSFDKRFHGMNKFDYEMSDDRGIFQIINRNWVDDGFVYSTQIDDSYFYTTLRRRYENTGRKDITWLVCSEFSIRGKDGELHHCIKKGKNFLKNEWYWQLVHDNTEYICYEVGRGKEGTFYCIYRNNNLVAMIRKDPVTIQFETHYDCYAYDDVPVEVLLVFNIYFDINKYSTHTRYENKTLHTWQKWLKEKYDPYFIETIRTNRKI